MFRIMSASVPFLATGMRASLPSAVQEFDLVVRDGADVMITLPGAGRAIPGQVALAPQEHNGGICVALSTTLQKMDDKWIISPSRKHITNRDAGGSDDNIYPLQVSDPAHASFIRKVQYGSGRRLLVTLKDGQHFPCRFNKEQLVDENGESIPHDQVKEATYFQYVDEIPAAQRGFDKDAFDKHIDSIMQHLQNKDFTQAESEFHTSKGLLDAFKQHHGDEFHLLVHICEGQLARVIQHGTSIQQAGKPNSDKWNIISWNAWGKHHPEIPNDRSEPISNPYERFFQHANVHSAKIIALQEGLFPILKKVCDARKLAIVPVHRSANVQTVYDPAQVTLIQPAEKFIIPGSGGGKHGRDGIGVMSLFKDNESGEVILFTNIHAGHNLHQVQNGIHPFNADPGMGKTSAEARDAIITAQTGYLKRCGQHVTANIVAGDHNEIGVAIQQGHVQSTTIDNSSIPPNQTPTWGGTHVFDHIFAVGKNITGGDLSVFDDFGSDHRAVQSLIDIDDL